MDNREQSAHQEGLALIEKQFKERSAETDSCLKVSLRCQHF
jgi:hypothetical protein